MKSNLEISPLEPGEFDEAAEVYRQSRKFLVDISGEPPQSLGLEMVAKEAAEAEKHGALFQGIRLKKNRQMVGVTVYEPSGYREEQKCAWIALLMIAEPFQGKGYGTEAYRLIEDTIFSNSAVRTIKLGVLANNPAALFFWRKIGYRETGASRDEESGHETIIMEKAR